MNELKIHVSRNYSCMARMLHESTEVHDSPILWMIPLEDCAFPNEWTFYHFNWVRTALGLAPIEADKAYIWIQDAQISAKMLRPYEPNELQRMVTTSIPGWSWLVYMSDDIELALLSRAWATYHIGKAELWDKPIGPKIMWPDTSIGLPESASASVPASA